MNWEEWAGRWRASLERGGELTPVAEATFAAACAALERAHAFCSEVEGKETVNAVKALTDAVKLVELAEIRAGGKATRPFSESLPEPEIPI